MPRLFVRANELGFRCYLTQLRANSYSKAEHPVPFLDLKKALDKLLEEGEVAGQEEEAEEGGPNITRSLSSLSIFFLSFLL